MVITFYHWCAEKQSIVGDLRARGVPEWAWVGDWGGASTVSQRRNAEKLRNFFFSGSGEIARASGN